MTVPPSSREPIVAELVTPEIQQMLELRQVSEARQSMADLLDVEVADILHALPTELQAMAFRILPRDRAADVFPYVERELQERLVESLSDQQLGQIFDEMDPDDRVEFLEDADDELVASLMAAMRPEEREETEKILEYPEESIGRLATPDYLTVRPDWGIGQALEHVRRYGKEAETVHTLYVVDSDGKLLDHVALRDIVTSDPSTTCEQLRRGQTVSLLAADDREEAVRTMERYDIPVLPVVDADGTLVGIVTFDDVADVAEEEVTEDIQKLGGMQALEEPYLSATLFSLVRKRVIWLVVLFGGGLLTVSAMGVFEEQLQKLAILALFVPLIIASGGNSGSQAATLIIRAMAIGEVTLGDWLRVFFRELASGLLMGLMIGILGLLTAMLSTTLFSFELPGSISAVRVGLTIGLSLIGVITIGTLIGSMLPLLLRRIGLDPATSSTPFVATIVDVAGLVIYFALAVSILGL